MKFHPWLSTITIVLLAALSFTGSGCMNQEQLQLEIEKAYKKGKNDGVLEAWDIAQEKGRQEGYQEGLKAGRKIGYQEGFTKGQQHGDKNGFQRGFQNGQNQGYALGIKKGMREGYANGYNQGLQKGKELGLDSRTRLGKLGQIFLYIAIGLASLAAISYLIYRLNKPPEFV